MYGMRFRSRERLATHGIDLQHDMADRNNEAKSYQAKVWEQLTAYRRTFLRSTATALAAPSAISMTIAPPCATST